MKLAIDVGGTYLRAELFGAVEVERFEAKTNETDLVAFVASLLDAHPQIDFVGIAYAGQVNDGVILSAPNIQVTEHYLKAYFESRYPIRLEIENDLSCAVMAEANYWNKQDIVAIYPGTGIGAGAISGGKLVRGMHSLALEIGHIPYHKSDFHCGCGRDNCLELFASGSGILKQLIYYGLDTKHTLATLKTDRNPTANAIAENFETALMFAAGTVITLFNPQMVVLGGGIVAANPYLIDTIRHRIGHYALSAALDGAQIVGSKLTNGVLEGAKLLEERIYG